MATLQPRNGLRVQTRSQGRRRRLAVEQLELRLALDGALLEVTMLPELDQFGPQIETVMGYKLPGETDEQARISYAIYDTGASVITVSASDALLHELLGTPIPIKVPDGAGADAIGGVLQGDVSMPGEIIADGMHAVVLTDDFLNVGIQFDANTPRTPGVQVFVGTDNGSPSLPTITGTVIHNPSPAHPSGTAAWIDMTAYKLDFGELFPEFPEFSGIVLEMPDLRFVEPNTKLTAPTDGSVSEVVRIPLVMWGENNQADPGDSISYAENPVQESTSFTHNGLAVGNKTMLFDTGAQLSVISTEIALQLGLDLSSPTTTITVQGAAGQETIPGYTIDTLELPRDDNGDGTIDGVLRFKDVPIYVLDVVPGLDGILGMNLFNLAHGMLFDPFDAAGPSLQVSYFTDLTREIPDDIDLGALDLLRQAFPALGSAGNSLPSFGLEVPVVNNAPTNITLSRQEVFAQTPGSWVGKIGVSDPDQGDTHTYTLIDERFEIRDRNLYLKSTASLDRATTPEVSLQVTATDAGGLSVTRTFALTTVDRPGNWDAPHQWGEKPFDFNLDGQVTLLDMAEMISYLNAIGPQNDLPDVPVGTSPGPFYDIDGDDNFNLTDLAIVLNYLNVFGQGEPPATSLQQRVAEEPPTVALQPATTVTSALWIDNAASDTASAIESESDEPAWMEAAPLVAASAAYYGPVAANPDWLGAISGSSREHASKRIFDLALAQWEGDDFAC